MDEKLQAVLAQLKLAPGAQVHSARMVTELGGGKYVRVLVDEGIGGMKVLVLEYSPQIYADKDAPGPPELSPSLLPEQQRVKSVATKRSRKK